MTLQQAAQQAIDVQDACNLSGVLGSFKNIVFDVLWPEARRIGKGTDWVNRHPIVTLFLDKLAHLNGTQNLSASDSIRAYDEVHKLAEGE